MDIKSVWMVIFIFMFLISLAWNIYIYVFLRKNREPKRFESFIGILGSIFSILGFFFSSSDIKMADILIYNKDSQTNINETNTLINNEVNGNGNVVNNYFSVIGDLEEFKELSDDFKNSGESSAEEIKHKNIDDIIASGADYEIKSEYVVGWFDSSESGRPSYTLDELNNNILGEQITFNSIVDESLADQGVLTVTTQT